MIFLGNLVIFGKKPVAAALVLAHKKRCDQVTVLHTVNEEILFKDTIHYDYSIYFA